MNTRTIRLGLAMAVLLLPAALFAAPELPQPTPKPAPQSANAPTVAPAPAASQEQEEPLEPLRERQLSLMEARILSRQGDLPKSLAIYEKLRAEYPDDQEVYEDFIETLAANEQFERVLFELVRFRKTFGITSRSERIEAGVYAELKRPQYGLDILERAMRGNPSDTGLWSDLGIQRQSAKDVNGAIQAFSKVLEADPDNQAARDALHGILLERRPNTEAGFTLYDQGRGAVTTTYSLGGSAQVRDNTRLFLDTQRVHLHRPTDQLTGTINEDLTVLGARVEHEVDTRLTLEAGLQAYTGLGDGLSPMVGARYDFDEYGRVRGSYAYHLPWYDDFDAARLNGYRNRFHLEYELPFREVWTAYAGYQRDGYGMSGNDDLGYRWEGTASLTRRFWRNPDVYLTYTLQRAESEPSMDIPFQLVRRELSHTGTVTVTKQLLPWLEASMRLGIKRDTIQDAESILFSPQLVIRPLERMRLTLGWDYTSQNTAQVRGGEGNTFSAKIAWTW